MALLANNNMQIDSELWWNRGLQKRKQEVLVNQTCKLFLLWWPLVPSGSCLILPKKTEETPQLNPFNGHTCVQKIDSWNVLTQEISLSEKNIPKKGSFFLPQWSVVVGGYVWYKGRSMCGLSGNRMYVKNVPEIHHRDKKIQ